MESRRAAVTELVKAWRRGDASARDRVSPLVYGELRKRAASYLRRERRNHTLSATALVHESYLRLVGQGAGSENRAQFCALAAGMMRRVLVDHARARAAAKRPRPGLQVTLDDQIASPEPRTYQLLGVDEALNQLALLDARQARLVELRYFGGLTAAEAAEVLGISSSTFKREWNLARAWLYRWLSEQGGEVAARPDAAAP